MFTNKKRAFTLIEMLIVIVIIGILAAALIPRLTGARNKAADVAVKAEMQSAATILASYANDNSDFSLLTNGPLTGNQNLLSGIAASLPRSNTYNITKVTKGGQSSGGIVITAKVSNLSSANWSSAQTISGSAEVMAASGAQCNGVTQAGATDNLVAGTCTIATTSIPMYMLVY